MNQKIGVIGAGAWGCALAQTLASAGKDVILWAREPEVVTSINDRHENTLFLASAFSCNLGLCKCYLTGDL